MQINFSTSTKTIFALILGVGQLCHDEHKKNINMCKFQHALLLNPLCLTPINNLIWIILKFFQVTTFFPGTEFILQASSTTTTYHDHVCITCWMSSLTYSKMNSHYHTTLQKYNNFWIVFPLHISMHQKPKKLISQVFPFTAQAREDNKNKQTSKEKCGLYITQTYCLSWPSQN